MSASTRREKIDAALAASRDTRTLEMGPGALSVVSAVFQKHFPGKSAVVVGDTHTMRVPGRRSRGCCPAASRSCSLIRTSTPSTASWSASRIAGVARCGSGRRGMASGAEHQFSHLWDMEHHTHNGDAPSHGFKVGIATLAVARLYEALYDVLPETLDVDRAVAQWPTWDETAWSINQLFEIDELRDKALEETKAKYVSPEALREQLVRYNAVSGKLKTRLREYLPAARLMEQMLRDVGAPTKPEQIGIPPARLRDSYLLAYHIRRRFTVLDLAVRAGVLDACLATVFAPQEAS